MNGEAPTHLLPSISRLLRQVGALERSSAIDLAAVSRQPVFSAEPWRKSISEFLRWSGSTLDVAGSASAFELILCHGRLGALALFKAFREYLIERGGSFHEANARLEALRAIVSMAAHWLRSIDWDLDEIEGLAPADFQPRQGERWTVELPADLAERLRNAAHWTPGLLPVSGLIERLVVEKLAELETAQGGPFSPRRGEGRLVEVEPGLPEQQNRPEPQDPPTPLDRTVRGFWKTAPGSAAKTEPALSVPPPRPGAPRKQF